MSEEKVIIPAYARIGVCKECGADVYAPEGGGLPLMSACRCGEARKLETSSGGPLAEGAVGRGQPGGRKATAA